MVEVLNFNFEVKMKKIRFKTENTKSKTKEELLQQGLVLKKERELKALHVVQSLALADKVDKDHLREMAKYINPAYYDDVVEERSIGMICGFPLCSNQVEHKFSQSQQFHISMRYKKVFDVTDRKKFCSNECFKGSSVLKEQLLTSPLWLREEDEIVHIVFYDEKLVEKKSSTDAHWGNEIEFENQSSKIVEELRDGKHHSHFVPESNDQKELDETIEHDSEEEDDQSFLSDSEYSTCELAEQFKKSVTIDENEKYLTKSDECCTKKLSKDTEMTPLNINLSDKMQTNSKVKQEKVFDKKRERKAEEKIPTIRKVSKFMEEWYTVDTLRLLHGETFLRKILQENNLAASDLVEDDGFLSNISNKITPEARARYIRLCRQLDVQQLQESNEDKMAVGNADLKKLPDFDQLKKDAEIQQLKVVSYLKGDEEIKLEEESTKALQELVAQVPLVDKTAQVALRRRIVTDQLDRVFPDLLKLFGLMRRDLNTGLQKLIRSFQFGPENIVMNLDEWTLTAIIILRMLCLFDSNLRVDLNTEPSARFFNLMLLDHGVDLKWIETFVASLHSDIKAILSKISIQHTEPKF